MNVDYEKIVEIARKAFDDGMGYIQDLKVWKELSSTSEVTVYSGSLASGITMIKTESFFNSPFIKIAEYFWANNDRLKLELGDLITHIDELKDLGTEGKIMREKSKYFGPFTPRETCYFYSKKQVDENTIVILSVSVPVKIPLTSGYLRGEEKIEMQLFESVLEDSEKTHFVTLTSASASGVLPNYIINQGIAEKAKYYEVLVNKLITL